MKQDESNIEVVAVYVDGYVRIYGPIPKKGNKDRPFIKALQFKTYGQALQFAGEFEQKQLEG